MGRLLGTGSDSTNFTTAASYSPAEEILAAGTPCVLDKILVGNGSTATAGVITVETAGGTHKHAWTADLTDPAIIASGLEAGFTSDGLRFTATGTGDFNLTFLYRTGF